MDMVNEQVAELDDLKRQLGETRAQLQQLIDRAQIQDLLDTYARGIDRGDLDVLKTVYHDDAIDEHGIFSGPGKAFAEFVTPYIRENYRMMQHHHTTTSFAVERYGASVETYFLCVQQALNGDLELSAGRCADRFEKRNGRWGIAYRQVIMDWTHLIPDASPTAIDDKFVRGEFGALDRSYSVLPALCRAALARQ